MDVAAVDDLIVRDLSKSYGSTQAAVRVNLRLRAGEIFGLLGPNGAGKTTVVESVTGLITPDSGSIEVCGIDARKHPARSKASIGASLQSTRLQDKITPAEAVHLFSTLYGSATAGSSLLQRFGLQEKADEPFDTLSGGQQQRLALALACVGSPQLLILDEPTTGLDPVIRREFHGLLQELRNEGRSILLTTHDMEEAEQLCDRIAVIDRGTIIAEGTPQQLIAESSATVRVVAQTSPAFDPAWALHLPALQDAAYDGQTASFTAVDANRALTDLLATLNANRAEVVSLRVFRATLEDVIVKLTGGAR